MTNPHGIRPGDTLFHVYGLDAWKPSLVTVEKVGRKWATLAHQWPYTRLDLETLDVDGRRGYGRCWRSEADWLAAKAARDANIRANAAWKSFCRHVSSWARPSGLDADTIHEAARVLGFDKTEGKP